MYGVFLVPLVVGGGGDREGLVGRWRRMTNTVPTLRIIDIDVL